MLYIERNRHPAGRMANMLFGLTNIADGLVRVLSLGHLHTRWPLNVASWQVLRAMKLKKERA